MLTAFRINAAERRELQEGMGGQAFEHLGAIADQAEDGAAVRCTLFSGHV